MKRLFAALATLLMLGTIGAATLSPAVVYAQADPFDQVCSGSGASSPVCTEKNKGGNPLFGPTGIITKVIQLMSIIVGVASVFMIIVGGMRYIFSHGDSGAINQARNTVVYAIAGLVVALASQAIVAFVLEKL